MLQSQTLSTQKSIGQQLAKSQALQVHLGAIQNALKIILPTLDQAASTLTEAPIEIPLTPEQTTQLLDIIGPGTHDFWTTLKTSVDESGKSLLSIQKESEDAKREALLWQYWVNMSQSDLGGVGMGIAPKQKVYALFTDNTP